MSPELFWGRLDNGAGEWSRSVGGNCTLIWCQPAPNTWGENSVRFKLQQLLFSGPRTEGGGPEATGLTSERPIGSCAVRRERSTQLGAETRAAPTSWHGGPTLQLNLTLWASESDAHYDRSVRATENPPPIKLGAEIWQEEDWGTQIVDVSQRLVVACQKRLDPRKKRNWRYYFDKTRGSSFPN